MAFADIQYLMHIFSDSRLLPRMVAPVATLFLCACAPSTESEWNVEVGDPVPTFSLKDTNDQEISSESMKGKPYVVSVFATWCPPCKTELVAFEERIWQPLKDQNIGVLAVNYGDEDVATIGNFARDNNLTFPILVDETGSFRQQTGVAAVPHSMVIGPDGKIVGLHLGYTDESISEITESLKAAKE